jgi:hypothetical protein
VVTVPACYEITLSGLAECAWDELEAVLTGRRQPRVMTHLARIVGYYSMLHAWNRSKIAELRDRHRGNYSLAEPAPSSGSVATGGAA